MMNHSLTELQSRAEEYALDRMPMGVVIVDDHLVVTFANRAARAILAHKSGLRLTGRVLTEVSSHDAGKLRRASGEKTNAIITISRPHHRPLHIFVCILPAAAARATYKRKSPAAIIFFSDPDAGLHCDAHILRQLYDLTVAEARTACALLEGQTLKETAIKLGVTIHTIRTHLKRIFEKTQTKRQGDLIRILVSGLCRLRLH